MDELSKIDVIRQRLGVSYGEAKEALDRADGDVLQALIILEKPKGRSDKKSEEKLDKKLDEKAHQVMDYIREIVKKGNVTKVKIKKGDRVVLDFPATVGALGIGGALLSPVLAVLGVAGTVAAFVNNYSLEIVRPDGSVEKHDLKFLSDDNKNEHQD